MNEYTDYTAREFINLIETMFKESVGKIGRLDVIWGMWSREMNMEISQRLNDDHPDSALLRLVFSYWIVVSQLLDLIYNYKGIKKFILKKKIKNKAIEVKDIREQIYADS